MGFASIATGGTSLQWDRMELRNLSLGPTDKQVPPERSADGGCSAR